MNTIKRYTLFIFLLMIGLVIVACGSQENEKNPSVSNKPIIEETIEDNLNLPPREAERGDEWVRLVDNMEMIYVAEGTFPMGKERGFSHEIPVHDVSLDAFWMDMTEVTNKQYALCVSDGSCNASLYADDSNYNGDDFPVVGVSWFDAKTYCEWTDAQLPTESEWEYAARGPEGLAYPWGDNFDGENTNSCDVHCKSARRDEVYDDDYGLAAPTGNYTTGKSWAGVLDMSGNVSEWVADWYDKEYYTNSSALNPQGPESGDAKVLRGGSWNDTAADLRSGTRDFANPNDKVEHVGFRCVIATTSN